MADPKMEELGLLPDAEVAKAQYASYISNGMMTQHARVELGKDIEQTHMRNRKMISEWAYELGRRENVIEKVVSDGKTYIVVNDFDKLRTLFGKMLREVQRIKSEGDFATWWNGTASRWTANCTKRCSNATANSVSSLTAAS